MNKNKIIYYTGCKSRPLEYDRYIKFIEAIEKQDRNKNNADISGFFMEEPGDDLLGIKIKRSNQTIEHRDYKDRNKFNN